MMGCLFPAVSRFPDIPPRAMIRPEVWVPFDHRDSETSGKMTDIGSLGIMGRYLYNHSLFQSTLLETSSID